MALLQTISSLGLAFARSISDFWLWVTSTSINDMLGSLAGTNFIGALVAKLLDIVVGLFSVFGLDPSSPVIDFFLGGIIAIVAVWLLDFFRRVLM